MLNAILAQLMAPGAAHVIFAVGGIAFGWWLKKHPDAVPPQYRPVVDLVLARLQAKAQAEAHVQLQSVAQPVPGVIHRMEDAILQSITAPAPVSTSTVVAK